jgi:peptidoglycan L-alanyl-D-glutamate endopeptidase CwlK
VSDATLLKIRQLLPELQDAAIDHLNTLRAAGLPAVIIDARRTMARQRAYVAAGRSRTLNSYHLKGRAYDIGWVGVRDRDVPTEWWDYAGEVGKSIGWRWGGDFKRLIDKPHFEF